MNNKTVKMTRTFFENDFEIIEKIIKKGKTQNPKFTTKDAIRYLLIKANVHQYRVATTDYIDAKTQRKKEANGLRGKMKVEQYLIDAVYLGHSPEGEPIIAALTSGRLQALGVNSKIIKEVMEMYKDEITDFNKQFKL
jgi:hypothetical protein